MSKWIKLSSSVIDLHFHEIIMISYICIALASYKALHLPWAGVGSINYYSTRRLIVVPFLCSCELGHITLPLGAPILFVN